MEYSFYIYLEIFISVAFFCLNGAMTRLFWLKIGKNRQSIRVYQAAFCLIGSIAYFISAATSEAGLKASAMTVFYAVLFGIFFALASHLSSECILCGPMSLTSLIMNLSLLIPLVYSCIFFKEKIGSVRLIGIGLLLITFAMSAFSSSGKSGGGQDESEDGGKGEGVKSKSVPARWIILVFIGFLANGLTAVIQKMQQSRDADAGNTFLFLAYLVSAIYFAVLFFAEDSGERRERRKSGSHLSLKSYYNSIPLLAVATFSAGIGSFVGNGLLGTLSTKVDAALLYPSINGGLAIMTAIVSFVFLKEKVTVKKALTLLVGVAAIILLNM